MLQHVRQCAAAVCERVYLAQPVLQAGSCHRGPRHVKHSSGICGQGSPRSDCASAQSDQGLSCSHTESLHTTEC